MSTRLAAYFAGVDLAAETTKPVASMRRTPSLHPRLLRASDGASLRISVSEGPPGATTIFLLGAPGTLALRALPAAGRDDPPGMREWLLAALHSRLSRFLTNPVVATVLFVAGFYGLYLSNLFDSTASSHAGHLAMNLHFLLSGYLFYWVVIGVDPTPRPIPPLAKVAVVFASLPLHAFFGVVLMGTKKVLGADYYRSLGLSWHTDLLGDQRLGGGIAWAAGEFPLVIVMLALLIQWARSDRRTATRLDRAAERDDDAELVAYNAMLAQLARGEKPTTIRPDPR